MKLSLRSIATLGAILIAASGIASGLPPASGGGAAWFLETQGEVRWCIQRPPSLQGADEKILRAFKNSLKRWTEVLNDTRLLPGAVSYKHDVNFLPMLMPDEPRIAANYVFNPTCDSHESFTVYLGEGHSKIDSLLPTDGSQAYVTHLESYDEATGAGRGWVWIRKEAILTHRDLEQVFDRVLAEVMGWTKELTWPKVRTDDFVRMRLSEVRQAARFNGVYDRYAFPSSKWSGRESAPEGHWSALVNLLTSCKDLEISRIGAEITHSEDHDNLLWSALVGAAYSQGTIRSPRARPFHLYLTLTGPETKHSDTWNHTIEKTYFKFFPDGPAQVSAGEYTGLFVRKFKGKVYWLGPRNFEASGSFEAFSKFEYDKIRLALGIRRTGGKRVRVSRLLIKEDGTLTFDLETSFGTQSVDFRFMKDRTIDE